MRLRANRSYAPLLRWLPIVGVAFLLALLPACKGGGDDSGGSDPLSCMLNTSFDAPSHATGTVTLQTYSNPCGELNLNVVFTGVSNIFTVGFDITYPSGTFSFNGFTQGPLLKQGSPATPPYFSVTETSPGRIAVFASRFSPDGSVSVTGETFLLTLRFTAVMIGQGPIAFDLSSTPVQEQVLNDSGGAVSVTFVNGSNLARVF